MPIYTGMGLSAPSYVIISVDGGPTFTNSAFDISQNVNKLWRCAHIGD